MILKNKIKKIIDAIKDTEISEIEITSFWGAQKIKLKKGLDFENSSNNNPKEKENIVIDEVQDTPNIYDNSGKTLQEDKIDDSKDIDYTIIRAPLVGTFYLSPKPGQPPFVENNTKINIGDTICIVEAMKIFNEIESDYAGFIKEILVKDGEPVEFDQPLFKIEEI